MMEARPPCKAVGGKGHIVWRILEILPKTMACFYEPMCGGAATFWALANAGRFRSAVLSDMNEDLIRTLKVIQRNHVGFLNALAKHRHTEAHYYRVRALDSKKMTDEECGARFMFLNKTSYCGLWRVSQGTGKMNTPWGHNRKMIQFADPAVIKACARVLNERKVTIVHADFQDVTKKMRLGDAAIFDPPYISVSETETKSFVGYTKGGFDLTDQRRLVAEFRRLDRAGIAALACNSDTDTTRKLYDGFAVETVLAARSINSDTTKRGKVKELFFKTSALVAQEAIARKFSAEPPSR